MSKVDLADWDDESVDPKVKARAASRSTWVSVAVNTSLSIVQVLVGLVSGSAGLIADGVHSLSDLVADFLVLFVSAHSKADPDERHPYGHHRFENAASLALGVLLLAVGAGMAWNAAVKINNHAELPKVEVTALYVALAALVAKEALFRYMLRIARQVRSAMLTANAWHARSDAASSLVVGIGIVGNLAGYPFLDPVAALVVGCMVFRMGWGFGWDALQDLMDQAADEELVQAIDATLRAVPGVRGCHNLRSRKMADMVSIDVHIDIDAELTVEAAHAIVEQAEQAVRTRHPVLGMMAHIDPWRP